MSEALENQVRERFTVDNDMKAEWCLNKIKKIRAEQSREIGELERQMAFYKAEMDRVNQSADADAAYFESILGEYFQTRIDEGFTKETKTKVSYKLPSGSLVLKHLEPEYEKDEAVILDWLKKNGGQFIRVKESLDWANMKKGLKFMDDGAAVDENGEVIPGIKAIARADEFVVEVK